MSGKKNPYLNRDAFKYEAPKWIFGVVCDYRITNFAVGDTAKAKEGQAKIVKMVDGYFVVTIGNSEEVYVDEKKNTAIIWEESSVRVHCQISRQKYWKLFNSGAEEVVDSISPQRWYRYHLCWGEPIAVFH